MLQWLTSIIWTIVVAVVVTVNADNLVGLGLLQSVSYIKPILTHEKLFAVGKSGATSNLFFLGLGWPWVGLGLGSSTVS